MLCWRILLNLLYFIRALRDAFSKIDYQLLYYFSLFQNIGCASSHIYNRSHVLLNVYPFYVYWTVHHLDSSVKRNQLDATYFIILFNAQHVSDVNTSIFRSLRLIRSYFMGCIWFGVCWRSVSVWLWWCGVFMQSEALMDVLTSETCWALNKIIK